MWPRSWCAAALKRRRATRLFGRQDEERGQGARIGEGDACCGAGRRDRESPAKCIAGSGGEPRARGTGPNAAALGEGNALSYERLLDESGRYCESRGFQREVRRNGGGEGHRVLQHVRTSSAAVLRQGARRVF